jgi:hypothetical protein
MVEFETRAMKGDYGEVFKLAVEAGRYYADQGILNRAIESGSGAVRDIFGTGSQ